MGVMTGGIGMPVVVVLLVVVLLVVVLVPVLAVIPVPVGDVAAVVVELWLLWFRKARGTLKK